MTDRSTLRNLEDKQEEILPTEKCFLGGKLPKKAVLKGWQLPDSLAEIVWELSTASWVLPNTCNPTQSLQGSKEHSLQTTGEVGKNQPLAPQFINLKSLWLSVTDLCNIL